MIYVVKLTFYRYFFQTLKSDGSPFLGQLRQERVIYLKRKPYYPLFESRFETGRISIMTGSTRVLVKVVLFQLRGHGHPKNDATPNFFPDSKSLLLGLSNEVLFVSGFFRKSAQNSQNVFLKTSWLVIYVHQCILHCIQDL